MSCQGLTALTLRMFMSLEFVAFGDWGLPPATLSLIFFSHDGVATMTNMSSSIPDMAESSCFPPAFG